jgi:tetratricopeptide (TPR) repeat protein
MVSCHETKVSSHRRIQPGDRVEPDVYFLPLAPPKRRQLDGRDVGVMCRRIPDFLHQLINHGETGPTGMVELQTPLPRRSLDASEVFARVPRGEEVRAVVTGMLNTGHEGFEMELTIHFRPDPDAIRPITLSVTVDVRDPLPALTRLASRLAGILEIPYSPSRVLVTRDPQALYRFLEGLDGSAPLSEILSLDPGFGLVLRVVHLRLAAALETGHLDRTACCRILDDCLRALPTDGEACVRVAGLLRSLGEEKRARAWLEQATGQPEPTAEALEALGLFWERGHPDRARELWQRGSELDGHPDFCAHLARLAFDGGDLHEAWSQVERGLRRILERRARRQEWPQDCNGTGHHVGLLLRLVAEHLTTCRPPAPVTALVRDLRGQLARPEERVELGLCLFRLGLAADGRTEVEAALSMDLDLRARDRAVRTMLALNVPAFERRFAAAVKAIRHSPHPSRGMQAMREFLIRQPEFWPGLFYLAIGLKGQGREDEALDALAEVLQMCPGHVGTLVEMAELFAARGNPKRALECVDEALRTRGQEARLHLRRAQYLEQLDRAAEAAAAVDRALALEKSGELAESSPLGEPL